MPNSRGELGFEYLPDDEETQTTRRYVNLQHESLFGLRDQLQVLAGIEEVSDDTYFEDLGTSLAVTSQTHLNRFLDLTFFRAELVAADALSKLSDDRPRAHGRRAPVRARAADAVRRPLARAAA